MVHIWSLGSPIHINDLGAPTNLTPPPSSPKPSPKSPRTTYAYPKLSTCVRSLSWPPSALPPLALPQVRTQQYWFTYNVYAMQRVCGPSTRRQVVITSKAMPRLTCTYLLGIRYSGCTVSTSLSCRGVCHSKKVHTLMEHPTASVHYEVSCRVHCVSQLSVLDPCYYVRDRRRQDQSTRLY